MPALAVLAYVCASNGEDTKTLANCLLQVSIFFVSEIIQRVQVPKCLGSGALQQVARANTVRYSLK